MGPNDNGGGDRGAGWIVLASLAVTIVYLGAMLWATRGHFVAQVADLYLIAQYARGFAEGHPFQFNPGEAPTTGATSLLHTALLAIAHGVGFRGEGLVAFAIVSGATAGVAAALLARRAAVSLGSDAPVAVLAGLLVAWNGPLAWSFHYGADIALVLVLSSWLFAAWVDERRSRFAWVTPAALLALTRPEGVILCAVLGIAERSRQARAPRGSALAWAPVAAGILASLAVRSVAGAGAHSSFAQKLLWENWGATATAMFAADYWTAVLRGILLGFYPSTEAIGFEQGQAPYFGPPFLLLLALLGASGPSFGARSARRFLGAALVVAAAVTPSIHLGVHWNRYLLFCLPPLLVLAAIGIGVAARRASVSFERPERSVFATLAAIALVSGLLSVARFGAIYGANAATTLRRDGAIFSAVVERFPENATFLLNGTSIEYMTGRRGVNLSGVVTPGFASILPAETEAAAFELLSRDDAGAVPPYLIAFDRYVEASPGLAALVAGPPLFATASLEPMELAIYPTRADLAGRQRTPQRFSPPPTLRLLDALQVGDPLDEAAHEYTWSSGVGARRMFAALHLDRLQGPGRGVDIEIADGGRVIFGFEAFEAATPGSGDVWIALRTHPAPPARVRGPDGERRVALALPRPALWITTPRGSTERFDLTLEPGWNEIALRVPAALVTPPRTRFRIEGRYASYAYWVFGG